ncbi:vanadium-dependent haloperoxidase [Paraglaciecola aquimarina]|uniref:Vanadium-dependent haloperoxidase n=1 Tax=Paraglaciecola algarum TaxID=3050085 RepID=A0ABS9DC42_9ALTE|nr:vanadium-dependent haloperoxidase [Paraglaciecola sp. G1-23]MCF2949922.1 vanadium-dependent haloperoxidase [Paraglaciecola sp. G1-23]
MYKMNGRKINGLLSVIIAFTFFTPSLNAQETLYNSSHSAARNWNEALLFAIRHDFARPTVHARNLYHSSALMYDLWSIFDDVAAPVFLGKNTELDACAFNTADKQQLLDNEIDKPKAVETAISYGMYRLLTHRFANSPGAVQSQTEFVEMANFYGVDRNNQSVDFTSGAASALGNYVANCLIEYGKQDGANEANDYANTVYQPKNFPLDPSQPGNLMLADTNRWQPLKLDVFIDQAGNETDTPPFLGAEWGQVKPFALMDEDLDILQRDGVDFWVYHDPGAPAYLDQQGTTSAEYQWGHALVAIWSSHLDHTDGVTIDISPNSIGNTTELPQSIAGLREFYSTNDGGSTDAGHSVNPATNAPYETQLVPRGDYTRVLAEFWADGPDSETPPGHWFTILNDLVSDHADFSKQYKGAGEPLSDLEWDIKAYLTLGGAVHDSAISAWGIKGWYDYIRPISAIRHMAQWGQSSNPELANYHENGLPLVDGFIELVTTNDPLAGDTAQHVGKVKLLAWKGPSAIIDPQTDTAGVDWILAENWWPYQRPSFVTPPFAGYVSGHSTFSRAAAEVLTLLTGNEFFPGGMGEFVAKKNEFLVFEQGPSTDIKLQWATYTDASDQTSLSRIWGGIHPPVDDVAGRRVGIKVGQAAFALAEQYFTGEIQSLADPVVVEPPPVVTPPVVTPPVVTPPGGADSSGGGSLLWLIAILFGALSYRCYARTGSNIQCYG